MNWEAISAVGEIVAASAVVVSLIYLAAQIRHNTRELDERNVSYRLTSLNEVAKRYTSFRDAVLQDPDLASVWHRGRRDLNELDQIERHRFDYLAVNMFWCWGILYLYRQQDVIDERVVKLSVANLHLYAEGEGIRQWWTESPHRTEYPSEFTEEVDRLYSIQTGQEA